MNERRLRELLAEADAASPPPLAALGTSEVVRRRAGRRRKIRSMLAMTLLIIVGGTIARLAGRHNQSEAPLVARNIPHAAQPVDVRIDPMKLYGEIEELSQEAEFHERLADQLIAEERHFALQRKLDALNSVIDSSVDLNLQNESAAAELVASTDEFCRAHGDKIQATERYRSIIELFPQTSAAPIAQRRLKQLES